MSEKDKEKLGIDKSKLRRNKPPIERKMSAEEAAAVSAGAVDKALDLAFNPTREKLREVTIIDRMQGRLFPQLDMVNTGRAYCLEIAAYRQDPEAYEEIFGNKRPEPPDLIDEFLFRTAQWQKSVAGVNLTKITDIALAETETRMPEDEEVYGKGDAWGKDE